MAKKSRKPHHPATDPPVATDDFEQELEEEQEETTAMPEEKETPEGEPKHPDPQGKMRSHAPGYTTGPEGESVELPKEEEEEKQ